MGTPRCNVLPFMLLFCALFFMRMRGDSHIISNCTESDRQALIEFKKSLVDELGSLSSWVGDDCCSWAGVTCSRRIGHVVSLVLYDSNLGGEINPSLLNLRHLQGLLLFNNNFSGPIPKFLGSFKHLKELDLSGNNFVGSFPTSIGNLSKLQVLDVSYNLLAGEMNPSLFNLKRLQVLDLENNKFSGPIPEFLGSFKDLFVLQLSYNNFVGSIPTSIGNLSKLVWLDVSKNLLTGVVSELHFAKLAHLEMLWMYSNLLVLNVSSHWVPPFQLQVIRLASCKLGPQFPPWLQTQTQLEALFIPETSISDTIPNWLCSTQLHMIDLSANQLSGELPSCLGYVATLQYLFLSNNNLHGQIPIDFGSERGGLQALHLSSNRLCGKLPPSLQNLTKLRTLDLGRNAFTDIIPPWLGSLPELKILSLQSNRFHGFIPQHLCDLPNLRLLNLAQNNLTGRIPPCFGNFTAMATINTTGEPFDPYYPNEDGLDVIFRGIERRYTSTQRYLISIDLSNNNIVGDIPQELENLLALKNLNLSGNHLKGKIPEKIGNLKDVECLDLSRNELSGPIPPSLSDLHFLSCLNLSFNNLSGRIPRGNQLLTLDDPSIYMGNSELCGEPTLKICPCNETTSSNDHCHEPPVENTDGEDDDSEKLWFYAGLGPGFLAGFLGFCSVLHFKKSWRYGFFQFVENSYNRLAVAKAALLHRKFHKDEPWRMDFTPNSLSDGD